MKRNFFILLLLVHWFYCDIYAQEVRTFTMTFEETAFRAIRDTSGCTAIISDSVVYYKHDGISPMLPFVSVNYCVPADLSFDSVSVEQGFDVYENDVILAVCHVPSKSSRFASSISREVRSNLTNTLFPKKSVEYIGETAIGDYKMLSFLVCPFLYNRLTRSLFFSSEINLKLCFKNGHARKGSNRINAPKYDLLRSIAYNSFDIKTSSRGVMQKSASNTPTIEYAIITGQGLKNAFKPLADWKKMKGVNSTIITVEEIDSLYTSGTTQQKIKQCLYDYYNQGLKYALLAGDVNIVPEQICALILHEEDLNGVQINHQEYNDMPTDLYYACFDGNFYWDANGNNIIGEPDDSISMMPNIYVTRVPVKDTIDATSFVDKILHYERTPTINSLNKGLLACGTIIRGSFISDPAKSDAEAIGDIIYNNYIQPLWNGNRVKFYDTYTDFSGGSSYQLNKNNLMNQLSQGYPFVQMISHGNVRYWQLEGDAGSDPLLSSPYVYSINEGICQSNAGSTIITTTACWTNAFNDPDNICLSESLINNPESGVIGYLGCSEEGWVDSICYGIVDLSLQYEAQYYNKLFSPSNGKKSFGKIVAEAKAQMVNVSLADFYYRWIQYGLNPIGDPEMPIYTSTPQYFGETDVIFGNNGFTVNTGLPDCTICVMSIDDLGDTFYNVCTGVSTAFFNVGNTDVYACITKQGYIPKIIEVRNVQRIQNKTFTEDTEVFGREIHVGTNVNPSEPSGPVVFSNGTHILKGKRVVLYPGTSVSLGAKLKITR